MTANQMMGEEAGDSDAGVSVAGGAVAGARVGAAMVRELGARVMATVGREVTVTVAVAVAAAVCAARATDSGPTIERRKPRLRKRRVNLT
jgi:uncharacterized membrane protein YfcA